MTTINDWCLVRWSNDELTVASEAHVGIGGHHAVRLTGPDCREQRGYVVSRHGADHDAAMASKAAASATDAVEFTG